jgi:hypothetical protein
MNLITRTMQIEAIRIGKRHRTDIGDIAELAASIADVGLLHPIVVTPTNELIAGERRIRACLSLGRTSIQATVIDLDRASRGEYAENVYRKAFTPSEWATIADAIEPVEREKAKERQGERVDILPGKFSTSSKGRALDHVARLAGKDRKTIVKARAICEAARADPERFSKLKVDMDRTGRVDGPFKRLTVMRQAAASGSTKSGTVAGAWYEGFGSPSVR